MSKRKLIHHNPEEAGRLACDAVGCDYVEPANQPFTADLIGKPCPRCGANLLTEKDYAGTLRMFAIIDTINRYFGFLGSKESPPKAKALQVRFHDDEVTIRRRKDD